jgi:hypothetical protein
MRPDLPDTIKPLIQKFYDQMMEINKRIFDLYLPDQQFLVKKALEDARQERYQNALKSIEAQNAMNQFSLGTFKCQYKYKKHKLDYSKSGISDCTENGFLIKHDGVTMLITSA